MYAVMWSEHCSYKSSMRAPRAGSRPRRRGCSSVPARAPASSTSATGSRSRIRIESHNHPSAVEPYQGAATGVGGIIRDVFSMGARPIALMDPLRFGPLDDARTRYLVRGRRRRHQRLRQRGRRAHRRRRGRVRRLLPRQPARERALPRRAAGRAAGARQGRGRRATSRCCSGSATGRDGIGGASVLASAGFEEGDEAKRPSVQVGDPFEEKRLIEACLELLDAGLAVGVQDLGAAGHLVRGVGDRGQDRRGHGRRHRPRARSASRA